METSEIKKTMQPDPPSSSSRWQKMLKVLLPLLIISAGIAVAYYINKTAPKARKKAPVKLAFLVQVEEVRRSNEKVALQAMGTVIPAREMQLKARVSGEIVSIRPEFMEGGILKTGDKILQIDPEDYRLAVKQKQREVANAGYELKMELGHQDVAKREWELLNDGKQANALDIELALRKPHLEKAKADLTAAEAELKQAQLDLDRTDIRAPFNAIIRAKNVELGSQVTAQDSLAELVGTDEYWIQVSIPVDRLKWISVPCKAREAGSKVRIRYGSDSYERTGTVIKLLGDMETEGRMARILVAVKDPLDLQSPETKLPPLLIGEYVSVEIDGRQLDNVFRIPRTALRDGAKIWIAGYDGKLNIRRVDSLWRDAETVLLQNGLTDGERLIVSDLAAPVEGMAVRIDQPNIKGPAADASQLQKSKNNSKAN